MLSLFIIHIIITLASLITGFLFYNSIIRDNNYEKVNQYRPVIFYLITGIIILTLITQIVILFSPVDSYYKIILLLLLLTGTYLTRKKIITFFRFLINDFKKQSLLIIITACAVWFLILMLNAGPTMMDDTESYHIQMVKWINEYGTVPGLANLHERFGFNSSWFSSISLFSQDQAHSNFYTSLNGVLSFWFSIYVLSLAGASLKKESNQEETKLVVSYFLIFIIALISWPIIRGNVSSCNYDFIALLILFVLFSEVFRSPLPQIKDFKFSFEWFAWPVFLFTVRIVNYPLLLLTLFSFVLLWKQKERRKITSYILISSLLTIPFFVRNVILSGYPFYPSTYLDWFNVDWKVSQEKTASLIRFIKYYNRVNTGIQSIKVTESMKFTKWILVWFKYMFTYDKILFIPGIAGLLIFPFLKIRTRLMHFSAIRFFFIVLCVQILSWFFIAPDPRFIYGCLFCGILLLLVPFEKKINVPGFIKFYKPFLLAISVLIIVFAANKIIKESKYRNWIFPAALPAPPVRTITINNIQLHIPEIILNNWNPRCYATPLPCVYEVDPLLEPRGSTIANGFRLKK